MLDISKAYTKHTIQARFRNLEEIKIMDSARMWKDETTKLRMELTHLKVLYMSACVNRDELRLRGLDRASRYPPDIRLNQYIQSTLAFSTPRPHNRPRAALRGPPTDPPFAGGGRTCLPAGRAVFYVPSEGGPRNISRADKT